MDTTQPAILPYLADLQRIYGSFDPSRVQTKRKGYYSFTAYPTAGTSVLTFFGQSIGQTNRQLTNLQQGGRLDNPLIVKSLRTRYYLNAQNQSSWAGTDVSTLYSDLVNGFFQAGVMRLTISSKDWLQLPQPFLFAPPAYGMPEIYSAGQISSIISRGPFCHLGRGKEQAYIMDPAPLISSDQNFQVTIEYPSGAIAAIATTIVTSNTTLYVGVELDGIEIRPVQ